MSSIAGHGCERIVPEEAKKTLEEIERSIVKRYRKPIWSKYLVVKIHYLWQNYFKN